MDLSLILDIAKIALPALLGFLLGAEAVLFQIKGKTKSELDDKAYEIIKKINGPLSIILSAIGLKKK